MTGFLLAAGLNLLRVQAGFLTSHLADLTVPALLYVISRGLVPTRPGASVRLMRWLGRTPERAAVSFFAASAVTELSQIWWPRGWFAGSFDPWDLAAFAAGILACYGLDKREADRVS